MPENSADKAARPSLGEALKGVEGNVRDIASVSASILRKLDCGEDDPPEVASDEPCRGRLTVVDDIMASLSSSLSALNRIQGLI